MISSRTLYALRFGLGFRPGDPEPETPGEMLAQLSEASRLPPPVPVGGSNARLERLADLFREQRASAKSNDQERRRSRQVYFGELVNLWVEDIHQKISHAVTSPYGFNERLVNFWGNHFAINSSRPGPIRGLIGDFEATAIRPNIAGYFKDMLWQAETHPAMVLYLDQNLSIGPNSAFGLEKKKGLNENLAREILELHTLGARGGYTQQDVRQFAELLTGMGVRRDRSAFSYNIRRAEPGSETVLGKQYGGRVESLDHIREALNDLARHPSTAWFIAWKLARHFIADTPPDDLVERMAQAYSASDGYLPDVYAVMLTASESFETFGAKTRQPLDYVIAGLRAVNADPETLQAKTPRNQNASMSPRSAGRKRGNPVTSVALSRMNQPLWRPQGPDGWPEETDFWITPQGLAERIRWSNFIGRQYSIEDPRALLEQSLREVATPDTLKWVSAAVTKAEGVALALASPEFNRR